MAVFSARELLGGWGQKVILAPVATAKDYRLDGLESRHLLCMLVVFVCMCACAFMCVHVSMELRGILGYPSSLRSTCLVSVLFCTTGSLTALGLADQARLDGQ